MTSRSSEQNNERQRSYLISPLDSELRRSAKMSDLRTFLFVRLSLESCNGKNTCNEPLDVGFGTI